MRRCLASSGLLLLAGCATSSGLGQQNVVLAKLHLRAVESLPVGPAREDVTRSDYRVTARIAETFFGTQPAGEVTLRLDIGQLPHAGSDIFALFDPRRREALWWDAADIGLCVHPDASQELFSRPPALVKALKEARYHYPCTPVGSVRLALPNGLEVTADSSSMRESDVRRTAAEIADQGWKSFCNAPLRGRCGSTADFEIHISLRPGHCIAGVSPRGRPETLAWYRCDSSYRLGPDR
jgi:hypothetical protein